MPVERYGRSLPLAWAAPSSPDDEEAKKGTRVAQEGALVLSKITNH
jgi:hypothetical protein